MLVNINGQGLKAVPLRAIRQRLLENKCTVGQAAEYLMERIPNMDFYCVRQTPLSITTGQREGVIKTGIRKIFSNGEYTFPQPAQNVYNVSSTLALDPNTKKQSSEAVLHALQDCGKIPVGLGTSGRDAFISFIDNILTPSLCNFGQRRHHIVGSAYSQTTRKSTFLALISPNRFTRKTHNKINHRLFVPALGLTPSELLS